MAGEAFATAAFVLLQNCGGRALSPEIILAKQVHEPAHPS